MVAQLHGHHAVALHHRLGGLDRIGKERCELRVGAGAVDQHPDLQVAGGGCDRRRGAGLREIDSDSAGLRRRRVLDLGRDAVENALPPGEQHHVDTAFGQSFGERRPTPSDAPATNAHGPYFVANVIYGAPNVATRT